MRISDTVSLHELRSSHVAYSFPLYYHFFLNIFRRRPFLTSIVIVSGALVLYFNRLMLRMGYE